MTMKFLEQITIPYLRLHAKLKINKNVFDVFSILAEARTILICMPAKLEDFGVARIFLNDFKQSFPQAKIVLLMLEQYRNLLDVSKKYGTIFVALKDVNVFGLPKKELLQKISTSKYDIAIDLNHSFHLLSTYLCQKSGAVLRVCLENREREPFYNFSFRYSMDEQLDNKYRKLVKYLNANVVEPVANS